MARGLIFFPALQFIFNVSFGDIAEADDTDQYCPSKSACFQAATVPVCETSFKALRTSLFCSLTGRGLPTQIDVIAVGTKVCTTVLHFPPS